MFACYEKYGMVWGRCLAACGHCTAHGMCHSMLVPVPATTDIYRIMACDPCMRAQNGAGCNLPGIRVRLTANGTAVCVTIDHKDVQPDGSPVPIRFYRAKAPPAIKVIRRKPVPSLLDLSSEVAGMHLRSPASPRPSYNMYPHSPCATASAPALSMSSSPTSSIEMVELVTPLPSAEGLLDETKMKVKDYSWLLPSPPPSPVKSPLRPRSTPLTPVKSPLRPKSTPYLRADGGKGKDKGKGREYISRPIASVGAVREPVYHYSKSRSHSPHGLPQYVVSESPLVHILIPPGSEVAPRNERQVERARATNNRDIAAAARDGCVPGK